MMAGCGNPFAAALFVQRSTGKKKKGVQTIATKFKSQLKELVDTLEATMPHYVRCVKPNDKKLKFNEGIDACEAAKMRRQLLYAGVMETIAIRKLGYPVREPYPDFWERCCKMRWCVCVKMDASTDPRAGTEAVVSAAIDAGLFVMGKTKVFGKGDMLKTIKLWHQVRSPSVAYAAAHGAPSSACQAPTLARSLARPIPSQLYAHATTLRSEHCRQDGAIIRSHLR